MPGVRTGAALYGRITLLRLRHPVLGTLVTHGVPGAAAIALLSILTTPSVAWTGSAIGWLVGSLVAGIARGDRSWTLPTELPEQTQLRVLQAVHDEPVIEDVIVARGVLGYLRNQPRLTRRGPWWLYVATWLVLSAVMALLMQDQIQGASLARAAAVHVSAFLLITAGLVSEWRSRTRARAAGAAASELLAAEDGREGRTGA